MLCDFSVEHQQVTKISASLPGCFPLHLSLEMFVLRTQPLTTAIREHRQHGELCREAHRLFPRSLAELPASSQHQLARHLRGPSWRQILLSAVEPTQVTLCEAGAFSAKSDPNCRFTGKINDYHCFNLLSLEWLVTKQQIVIAMELIEGSSCRPAYVCRSSFEFWIQ